jgi:uncharacterized protein (TIGR00297 family)
VTLPPLVALGVGPLVAIIVWRLRLLSTGGAITAAALGVATAQAGVAWIVLLLLFFVSSVLLSRVGRDTKRHRSANVIAKGGARDARQVMANGAVFGASALLAASMPAYAFDARALALGALAAATADTWGTEIGMLSRSAPRSVMTLAPLEPGMSGGVTVLGLAATLLGAAIISASAVALDWSRTVAYSGVLGGVVGAMSDSVLGATLQHRRRSVRTGHMTERLTDHDGTATIAARGVSWFDNDAVNAAATAIGAGVSLVAFRLLSRAAA